MYDEAPECGGAVQRYLPIDPAGYALPGRFYRLRADACGHGPADALLFQRDREAEAYRRQKLDVLRRAGSPRSGGGLALPGSGGAREVARRFLVQRLGREHPDLVGPAARSLDELALGVQEDIVVLAKDVRAPASEARICYAHVCFPSSWPPEAVLGADFAAIHHPVPGRDAFAHGQPRARLAQSMFGEAKVRFVWTVTPESGLDLHPSEAPAREWREADTGLVRVERQVALGVDDAVAIFLIRVYLYPFATLTAHERRLLRSALAAMPADIARYKRIEPERERVLLLLDAAASNERASPPQP